jgi:hypothetical protein
MAKHSPGPWSVQEPQPDMRGPEPGTGDRIIVAANQICPGIVYEFGAEGRANSSLIAAAPTMHEANKFALLALCAVRELVSPAKHPNLLKDIDHAIEANRAAIDEAGQSGEPIAGLYTRTELTKA